MARQPATGCCSKARKLASSNQSAWLGASSLLGLENSLLVGDRSLSPVAPEFLRRVTAKNAARSVHALLQLPLSLGPVDNAFFFVTHAPEYRVLSCLSRLRGCWVNVRKYTGLRRVSCSDRDGDSLANQFGGKLFYGSRLIAVHGPADFSKFREEELHFGILALVFPLRSHVVLGMLM